MLIDNEILIRKEVRPTDLHYIFDSWLEDYRSSHFTPIKGKKSASFVGLMPSELYYKEQRPRIDKILKKSKVLIVCNKEDTDQIFAYAVFRYVGDITILSWLYVRPVYRKLGIAKKLIHEIGDIDVVTHMTPARWWFLKKFNLIYNPYMEDKL